MRQRDTGPSARRWFWLALVLLLAATLAVILLLPRVQDAGRPVPVREPPAEPATPADPLAARSEAESGLRALLRQRARLELGNAQAWGDTEWDRAQETTAAADVLFQDGRYPEAAQAYGQAARILEDLEASRPARLGAALAAGEGALADNEWEQAVTRFELALRIEPDEERALEGLARAQVRGDLLHAMQAGKEAEDAGDLEAAQAAYRQAVALDAGYEPAAGGLTRVSSALDDSRFSTAMSGALSALDAGRLSAADRAIEEAAAVRPGDPALADLRQRLARVRQGAELERLRGQAQGLVGIEDWQGAAVRYQRALEQEPNAGFAREGLALARERIRVHDLLDRYLKQPDSLYASQTLADAEALLSAAGVTPDAEPRLREKMARLRRRVAEARTPLPVVLRSDGLTEVTVYHVGRLGRFTERRLDLPPGDYTATGSRIGYRDVRLLFRLRPGTATPLTVDVRCEERI